MASETSKTPDTEAAEDGDGSLVKKRVRYRLLREVGQRAQRTYAAMRTEGGASTLVITQRFADASGSAQATPEERVANQDVLRGIAHEGLLLKKNWHPNIGRVRHVDEIDDCVFLATDFLDGVTLEEFLALANAKSLALHPEEPMVSHAVVARIFLDVLSGLSALHALREDGASTPLGTYHGALCPANIVIGKDGVARLIATFRARPSRVSPNSEALGYAAPEALTDESTVDARADIFAVGVMLWETLTEKRLYPDNNATRIAQRQREEEVPRPNARLADVVLQALAFDPLLRYRTAQDMATNVRSLAGSIATGSALAQLVNDLAGDRIRSRRLEVQGGPIGSPRKSVNPAIAALPKKTQSGSLPRVQAPTIKAATPADAFKTLAAQEEERQERQERERERNAAPPPPPSSSTPYASSPSSSRLPVVTTPPGALSRASASRMTPPPGRVRRLTPREFRAVDPTAEMAAPIVAHAVPTPVEEDDDDDDLPGPRPSTPDSDYVDVLAAEARAQVAQMDAAETAKVEAIDASTLDDSDLLLEEEAEAAPEQQQQPTYSSFIGPNDAIEPEVAQFAREVVISETSVTPPPEAPAAPDWTPLPLPSSPPLRSSSSTKTPFVVDVASRPSSRPSRSPASFRGTSNRGSKRMIPIIALMAIVSIAVLLAGAAIIASRSSSPTTTNATSPSSSTPVDPPSTVIVPPPPAVDVLPSASAPRR